MNRQTALGMSNDTINGEGTGGEERLRRTKSNNSFNRSANSAAFIRETLLLLLFAAPG
jgi:hypothetical protein